MQAVGSIFAILGTGLIVLAVLQFATALLGDAPLLVPALGVVGAILLVIGAWIVLRESRR
jgi:hypothetical protein